MLTVVARVLHQTSKFFSTTERSLIYFFSMVGIFQNIAVDDDRDGTTMRLASRRLGFQLLARFVAFPLRW